MPGKRLEDLHLSDQPIVAPPAVDPRDTDWYRFCREIDDLYATGHYEWACKTLFDIQEAVEWTHTVSEGQRRAVANIEAARGRRGSRRYEGFGR
jgi:hypothetical protein